MNPERIKKEFERCEKFHGHLCNGIVLGILMTLEGAKRSGFNEQSHKDFIIISEMARCMVDAVTVVSGLTVGKKALKIIEYGKMAICFVNIHTNKGIRISPIVEVTPNMPVFWGPFTEKKIIDFSDKSDLANMVASVPIEKIFKFEKISVSILPEDLPGKPTSIICVSCGEQVRDKQEIEKNGLLYCQPCANGGYYGISGN